MHGSIHYNRNLIVRAKIQEVHERIEAELLEEMTSERDMMTGTGEDWESEASEKNVYYDESIISKHKTRKTIVEEHLTSEPTGSQPIPTITGNRPSEQQQEVSPAKALSVPQECSPPPTIASQTKLSFPTPPPFLSQPPPVVQHISNAMKPVHGQSLPNALAGYTSPQLGPSQDFAKPPPPVVTKTSSPAFHFSQPPPSFSKPPPSIQNPRSNAPSSLRGPAFTGQNQMLTRPSLTKPPQKQSFICHNPSLRVRGINPLSQPNTTSPRGSVSQDSVYNSNSTTSMLSKFDNLSDIKVSVDNNLFTPQTVSRKRKSETEAKPDPLKDEGIELVLANFAEGTSGADIFKLLDPFNVAGVNMAVNKLTPNDDFTFCFVRFSSRQEAEVAIQQLDGKPLLNSGQIVLEFA
eukprot:TRINITY_DN33113_c0_g1_i1.p1 TRINITY_DN33113_c0_g1~~TRINITY_DN33113_c0_g1_i1.p1  ORF type:complete len:418 (-),score=131.55 TRINITY_DN33113_c0_g1_i1:217-1434(-)